MVDGRHHDTRDMLRCCAGTPRRTGHSRATIGGLLIILLASIVLIFDDE